MLYCTDCSYVTSENVVLYICSTKLGMYKEKCGLSNVLMSWGHDEYLYHLLRDHTRG